jgi:hypothetical protein
MRQGEIDRLPTSIEYSKIQVMLHGLGLTPGDVAAMHMYPRCIEVEVYATDETGRKFLGEDGAVKHTLSIKVDYDQ